jgi:hypothetical protein
VTAPVSELSPVVIRDVFPAQPTLGSITYRSARVIVTRERVYVWTPQGRERLLVVDEPYLREQSTIPRYNAPPRDDTILALVDGRTLTVRRQRGCGCNSPLRGWRPWSPFLTAAA